MKKKTPKPTYKIAEFLPMRLRRKMATRRYDLEGSLFGVPVCKTGRCPLGWLFADPPKGKLSEEKRVPAPYSIARRIKRLFPKLTAGYDLLELEDYAGEFTTDWDSGLIKNLHKALGVPKPKA